jgi:hypothetical protein
MLNDAMKDALAADLAAETHQECIECQAEGCSGCGSSFCDLPRLVEHEREWMCPGCIPAFDAHVANRCTGDVCNCESDGVPVLLADDQEETTPLPFETMNDVVFGCRKMEAA